ncbi:hypothetical protein GCM10023195_55550 [Actinoallomurus liliacearum]|uniref:Uncharacterized protein n=1 Tax=Actinoallomurus liliacearum TaxID=1080073 RepID=A0ABP8TR05_9ACTN
MTAAYELIDAEKANHTIVDMCTWLGVGAVLMEQTDEWTEASRYMGLEFLAKALWVPIITSVQVMRHVGTRGGCRRAGLVGGCEADRVGLVR